MPLLRFLQERVFTPVGMASVSDTDQAKLGDTDPTGYLRYALGPLRPAAKEGRGWLVAAGELAMPAADLAKWDISMMDQKLLKPASYREFGKEVLLNNGLGTHYGLGVDVNSQAGHRALSHGGEVSGFTAQNIVFPDDRAAVVVLTNQDAASASSAIANGIAPLLFATNDPATPAKLEQAKKIFEGLQHGTIDRSVFTDNANSYFSAEALKDFASGLGPMGKPQQFDQVSQGLRCVMTLAVYLIKFPPKTLPACKLMLPPVRFHPLPDPRTY